MTEQTIRTQMLLGEAALARLRSSRVAVLGLGGVGSWCAEALARAGVGALTLVDEDTVSESNLNRQCCALHSTIGQPKAAVMAARVHDIDPSIAVDARAERYEAATRERFFDTEYDYIADCIDLVSCKVDLIRTAHARGIPIVSALGTGNKMDASRFERPRRCAPRRRAAGACPARCRGCRPARDCCWRRRSCSICAPRRRSGHEARLDRAAVPAGRGGAGGAGVAARVVH